MNPTRKDSGSRPSRARRTGARGDPSEAIRLQDLEREHAALLDRLFHLERLAQAGILAGGLVHDTRNLLAAISGNCQIAMLDPTRSAGDVLDKVHRLALQAAESMQVFMTFVRRGGAPRASCDLHDVTGDALRFLAPVLSSSGVKVTAEVEAGLVVPAERTLLLQVLVNLVQNAVRAANPASGHVEIVGWRAGDLVLLDVRDDGPGIPEEVRARLFEPFATGHGESGGTGLGLFSARRIVEGAGGSVIVVPFSERGTTFRVRFSAVQVEARSDGIKETPR